MSTTCMNGRGVGRSVTCTENWAACCARIAARGCRPPMNCLPRWSARSASALAGSDRTSCGSVKCPITCTLLPKNSQPVTFSWLSVPREWCIRRRALSARRCTRVPTRSRSTCESARSPVTFMSSGRGRQRVKSRPWSTPCCPALRFSQCAGSAFTDVESEFLSRLQILFGVELVPGDDIADRDIEASGNKVQGVATADAVSPRPARGIRGEGQAGGPFLAVWNHQRGARANARTANAVDFPQQADLGVEALCDTYQRVAARDGVPLPAHALVGRQAGNRLFKVPGLAQG